LPILAKLHVVAHGIKLLAHPRSRLVVEPDLAGAEGVVVEGFAHLERDEGWGLRRFLRRHPELNDVEEILQQVLVLPVAPLNGECKVRHPVLQCERGRKGCAWTLARRDNIEWILDFIEHEALHALREADSGVAGNHRGDPATARRNRYDPT